MDWSCGRSTTWKLNFSPEAAGRLWLWARRLTRERYPGSSLRIGIVHARWNEKVIHALLDGAKGALKEAGVLDENVVVQSVPGSYELPLAVQR